MLSFRAAKRQSVRIDQAKPVPRVVNHLGPRIRSTVAQRAGSVREGEVDTLRSEAREHIAQEVGHLDVF